VRAGGGGLADHAASLLLSSGVTRICAV
jgi:hypothetical protein